VVAFVASLIVTVLLVVPIVLVGKRRPKGTPVTWGEALLASTYLFLVMWWVYGVVPHYWLTWADSELGFRTDRIFVGPGGVLRALPMTITGVVVRDIVATLIYVVFLGLQIAAWALWQGRGEKKVEVETSDYGRPLVKEGATVG
jgi:hypothetical protein